MSFVRTVRITLLALSAMVGLAAVSHATNPTLDDLQAAFDGESNANARYLAFAEKADADGYHQVASLFRAAATAEKIHADNHAKVIKDLGGEPRADIGKPDVKSTRDNLAAAIAGESYERDTMYPGFIKTAETAGLTRAVRTFKFAIAAEAHHATLYAEALANLEGWREGARAFYVCPVCGETVSARPDARCPVCKASGEKFLKVD